MGNGVDDGRCRERTKQRPDAIINAHRVFVFVLLPAATYSPTPVAHAVALFTARRVRSSPGGSAADGRAWATVWMTVAAASVQNKDPMR